MVDCREPREKGQSSRNGERSGFLKQYRNLIYQTGETIGMAEHLASYTLDAAASAPTLRLGTLK